MSVLATNVRRNAPEGFIIVAVLWILGALAALVSIYAVYVIDTASAFTVHEDRLQSEALVSAAVELAAYEMTATPIRSRPTHGQFDFRMAKANIAVSFQSEAARVDLNAAPKELLAGLFVSLNADPDSAAKYADRIVIWRTRSLNAQGTSATGQATGADKASPEARFYNVNELSAVPGLPIDLIERALPFVTVYSGRPLVNIADAAPEVLAALPGMNHDLLKAVLAQRQAAGDGKALLQLLGPAGRYATTDGSQAARVTIQITYDNRRRAASQVIILPFDDGSEPYTILSWHDESEPDDRAGAASL